MAFPCVCLIANFCSTRTIVRVLTTSRKVDLLECLFVLGKFKDDYWSVCEPMRNELKVAGNLAQLHCTECTQTEGTVEQEYWHEGTSIGIAVGTVR